MSGTIAKKTPYVRGFPVYMSRYVIFTDASPRRVAMRFFNGSDESATGLLFVLTEKDEAGETIAERTLERKGFLAESGTEFAVSDAEVNERCAAVETRVLSVGSDGYEYVIEGDGAKLRYGTSESGKAVVFSKPHSSRIRRRYRKLAVLCLGAVFGMAAIAGGLAYKFGLFDGVRKRDVVPEETRPAATERCESFCTKIADVSLVRTC